MKKSSEEDITYECEWCNKEFDCRSTMYYHLKIVHEKPKALRCKFCKKQCESPTALARHTRTHTGEKPFACSICNKAFSQKAHLRTHQLSHSDEKPHKCDVCPPDEPRFVLLIELVIHDYH